MVQRFIAPMLVLALAASVQAADQTAAAGTATPKVDAAKGQEVAAQVCAACHNPDGNSTIAQNPKLAGQHAAYLAKQLHNFKAADGKPAERVNAIMNGMAAVLSEQDVANVAAFYSSQVQKGEKSVSSTDDKARKLYRAGDASRNLPACAGCHGATGAGIPNQYPRISGQWAEYTEAQLKAFRNGERANDPNKMMQIIAAKMSDAEIKAIADYIAGLR